MEKLIDFLKTKEGYYIRDDTYLIRPDNSVAAEYKKGGWITRPLQEEMVDYNLQCGRAFPSKLVERDLTNPGSK